VKTDLTEFWDNHDLKNAIFEHHGEEGPPTFEAGRQIDGILVSSNIQVRRCGYLPHTISPGDHRIIWIDLDDRELYGQPPRLSPKMTARKLQLHDPRVTY